ncbi:MAG: hypothetical protein ACKOFU_04785 [Actinomycetota bacterium]
MGHKEVADSRTSATKTIRVVVDDESYEDFTGDNRFFFCAFVNESVWSGNKMVEEERYLYIYRYDTQHTDSDGHYLKNTMAMFPAESYLYVRTV